MKSGKRPPAFPVPWNFEKSRKIEKPGFLTVVSVTEQTEALTLDDDEPMCAGPPLPDVEVVGSPDVSEMSNKLDVLSDIHEKYVGCTRADDDTPEGKRQMFEEQSRHVDEVECHLTALMKVNHCTVEQREEIRNTLDGFRAAIRGYQPSTLDYRRLSGLVLCPSCVRGRECHSYQAGVLLTRRDMINVEVDSRYPVFRGVGLSSMSACKRWRYVCRECFEEYFAEDFGVLGAMTSNSWDTMRKRQFQLMRTGIQKIAEEVAVTNCESFKAAFRDDRKLVRALVDGDDCENASFREAVERHRQDVGGRCVLKAFVAAMKEAALKAKEFDWDLKIGGSLVNEMLLDYRLAHGELVRAKITMILANEDWVPVVWMTERQAYFKMYLQPTTIEGGVEGRSSVWYRSPDVAGDVRHVDVATAILPASQCDWFYMKTGSSSRTKNEWRSMANGDKLFTNQEDGQAVMAMVRVSARGDAKLKIDLDDGIDQCAMQDCDVEIVRIEQPQGSVKDAIALFTVATNAMMKAVSEESMLKAWNSITDFIRRAGEVVDHTLKRTALKDCRAKYVVQDPLEARDLQGHWGKQLAYHETDGVRIGSSNHIGDQKFLYNLDNFAGYNHNVCYPSSTWAVMVDSIRAQLPEETRQCLWDACQRVSLTHNQLSSLKTLCGKNK